MTLESGLPAAINAPGKTLGMAGGDPFHLWQHSLSPLGGENSTGHTAHLGQLAEEPRVYQLDAKPGEYLFLADTYPRWYIRLLQDGLSALDAHATADVVCKPVGWLGRYRKSPHTKLWHRGDHELHVLGNVD